MSIHESSQAARVSCPDCCSTELQLRTSTEGFQYGLGEQLTTLYATVPVFHCISCGFEFTDHRAETARHEAVCRHLGVLTPREIVAIREEVGLSRAEFADLGGFGIASLQRWETGALIQNAANDRLIYLLQFTANRNRLHRKAQDALQASSGVDRISDPQRDASLMQGRVRRATSLAALAREESLIRSSAIFSELLTEGAVFQHL